MRNELCHKLGQGFYNNVTNNTQVESRAFDALLQRTRKSEADNRVRISDIEGLLECGGQVLNRVEDVIAQQARGRVNIPCFAGGKDSFMLVDGNLASFV